MGEKMDAVAVGKSVSDEKIIKEEEGKIEKFLKVARSVKDEDVIRPAEYPVHLGGPWYELSSGEKVKGKEAAEDAEMAL